MSGIRQYIYNTFSAILNPILTSESNMASDAPPTPHIPTVDDVLSTKSFLMEKSNLPLELVDTIIDFAEYWPRTMSCRSGGELAVRAGNGPGENVLLLRSYPLGYIPTSTDPTTIPMIQNTPTYPSMTPTPTTLTPSESSTRKTERVKEQLRKSASFRGEAICKKIVITLKSHDQGWGGQAGHRGTYEGSYTWFELGKERIFVADDDDKNPTLSLLPTLTIPTTSSSPTSSTTEPATETTKFHLQTISPAPNPSYNPTAPLTSLPPFIHPLLPSPTHIQRNLTSTLTTKTHTITLTPSDNITDPDSNAAKELGEQGRGRLSMNGEFIRGLQVGDVVTVWGKARFGGWGNWVEGVEVELYWAV